MSRSPATTLGTKAPVAPAQSQLGALLRDLWQATPLHIFSTALVAALEQQRRQRR